jgi:hypothetical protein
MMNSTWTQPTLPRFNGEYQNNNFCFTTDGGKIFFRSWRPLPGHNKNKSISSLWYAERSGYGWSESKPLRCGGKFMRRVGQPGISSTGTLYFATRLDDSFRSSDIYSSRFKNGAYSTPKNLGTPINTKYGEADLCVAPDESFMIVTCWNRPDNNGDSDLYVSYRKEDGTWSSLINMGNAINRKYNESAPSLSPDKKYLFYVSVDTSGEISKCSTYWISTKIIEELKPYNLE